MAFSLCFTDHRGANSDMAGRSQSEPTASSRWPRHGDTLMFAPQFSQALPRRFAALARCAVGVAAAIGLSTAAQAAWEPTKPVEFVVPAGTGGGADQMARLIQGIVIKHKLMKEPLIVVNKSGGAGAEGFLDGQGCQGRPAQDRHHPVQPVHHAHGDRCAFQLEGHDSGGDAGARPVRAVGQRRDALQDAPRSISPRSKRPAPTRSRWAAPAPSRKTRSSR